MTGRMISQNSPNNTVARSSPIHTLRLLLKNFLRSFTRKNQVLEKIRITGQTPLSRTYQNQSFMFQMEFI
jgi:hypothetical protein